jgi:hypothetical protein
MKRALHTYLSADDNFIITAPNYKIMSQSTIPAFLKLMDGYGSYNKTAAEFKMFNGGTCYMRTETDPDSVVGVTNVRHIWADEAGKYGLYFWENLQARAEFLGASIDLTTSPYSLNWIFKELIKPHLAGKRNDITLIQAPSWENPYHSLADPEKRRQRQATMDPRRFNMVYGGEFGKMQGLVYDCFDDVENQIPAFELPMGTRYHAGIDWGYTEPFVLKIRAITPDGRHYGVSEFYKTQFPITDIVGLLKQKHTVFDFMNIWCDPSQPGLIQELCNNKLPAVGAENDIKLGVGVHYELLKTRRLKYFRGQNPHTLDEIEQYHYPDPEDLGPDDDSKDPNPVGQNDHAVDADRYISVSTYRSGGLKVAPKVPDEVKKVETRDERYRRLIKVGSSKNTEDWS